MLMGRRIGKVIVMIYDSRQCLFKKIQGINLFKEIIKIA
jgi:hypothetical protein